MKSLKTISMGLFLFAIAIFLSMIAKEISHATSVVRYDVPFSRLTKETQKQIVCLAENIYFEARNEPIQGHYAVAFVTMNRVNSANYPTDICGVVKQKINGVCQFSWWCEDRPRYISTQNILTKMTDEKYNEILKTAINFYVNYEKLEDPTKGALFYHADYVNPQWRNMHKITQIGRHIFYERKSNATN